MHLSFWLPAARTSQNDGDRWTKAARNEHLAAIMSLYEPGELVAYDIVPPLAIPGYQTYTKHDQELLDQFQEGIEVEYRGLKNLRATMWHSAAARNG
jgi:ketosteroid isomerase-like protein